MIVRDVLSETQRNRLLRRVDWRFALRNPRPRQSICFSANLLTRAVAVISDAAGSTVDEAHASCDLAVASNPNAKMLSAAWAALDPGGVLYTEWTMPLGGRARRVQQMLRSSGFHNVQCYWCWPPINHSPLFWIPLGTRSARSAWRFLLASRPPDRHRLRQGMRWLGRIIAYGLHALGLLGSVCAIASKPDGADHSAAASPLLAEWLRAHWSEWQFGATPDEVSLLLLTGGQRSINKVVALAFTGQDSQPCLVVKMPRVTDAVPGLQREAAILKTLQARRTTPLPGVPRIIFSEEHKSSFMLGETALTGVPLFTQLDRRNYRTWAFKATDWLIALAAAPQAISRDNWWSRLVEPILNDFQRSFAAIVDRHMLQETHLILMQLDSLPLVCEQRDFSPWNVLITATGELVVLDWESAVLDGLPGLDLIYFLTYLTFFVSGAMKAGAFVKAYRAGWSEQTLLGQVNAACLQHYCAALKLDEACLSALRPLTWLLHSRSEYARLTADASGAPLTETLRQSVFVQLWEEEMRRAKMKQGSSI